MLWLWKKKRSFKGVYVPCTSLSTAAQSFDVLWPNFHLIPHWTAWEEISLRRDSMIWKMAKTMWRVCLFVDLRNANHWELWKLSSVAGRLLKPVWFYFLAHWLYTVPTHISFIFISNHYQDGCAGYYCHIQWDWASQLLPRDDLSILDT